MRSWGGEKAINNAASTTKVEVDCLRCDYQDTVNSIAILLTLYQ